MPNARTRAPNLPRLPKSTSAYRAPKLPGAVDAPRAARLTQESLLPYPPKPPSFQGPLTEWICWWWLGTYKKFVRNHDWYYQAALPALGVFASRDFTRVDFLLPVGGDHPASAGAGMRAVVWDPITPFTHRDPSLDRLKRNVLAASGYQLVWIDGATLEASPFDVLEKALRGVDVSSRGRGE